MSDNKQQQIEELQKQLNTKKDELKLNENAIDIINRQMKITTFNTPELQNRENYLKSQRTNLQNKLDEIESELDRLTVKNGDKVTFVYGRGRYTGKIIEKDGRLQIEMPMNRHYDALRDRNTATNQQPLNKQESEIYKKMYDYITQINAIQLKIDQTTYQIKQLNKEIGDMDNKNDNISQFKFGQLELELKKKQAELEKFESELKQKKDELINVYPKQIIDIDKVKELKIIKEGGRKRRSKRAVKTRKPKRRIRRSRRKHSRSSHRK